MFSAIDAVLPSTQVTECAVYRATEEVLRGCEGQVAEQRTCCRFGADAVSAQKLIRSGSRFGDEDRD